MVLESYTDTNELDEKGCSTDTAFLEKEASSDSISTSAKHLQIQQACEQKDVASLGRLASSSGGLLNDGLRQLAWPILLECPSRADEAETQWRSWPKHRDEEQVQLDVDRAFVYYPSNESQKVIEARKRVLFDLIVRVLRTHPMLCYFQGFHDIVQVVMLVLGAETAFPAIESISMFRIRDYMLPSMSPAIKHLELLPCILHAADQDLARHLMALPHVHYALPAALTLYAHDIEQYSDIARLFDFILAHEPVMSIYLFAAIIMSRRDKLLEIPDDEHDMLFFTLQKLPQPLDLEPLITRAVEVFEQYPPNRLPGRVWWSISSSSVLKTARSGGCMTTQEAERCFDKQAAEIRRAETRQKAMRTAYTYRRPLATTAAAIAIGALSIWLRRSGNDRYLLSVVSALMKAVKR